MFQSFYILVYMLFLRGLLKIHVCFKCTHCAAFIYLLQKVEIKDALKRHSHSRSDDEGKSRSRESGSTGNETKHANNYFKSTLTDIQQEYHMHL
jgi:hypothetical protein